MTLQILDHCRTDTATEYRKKHVCDLVFAPHWAGKGENCDLQFVPCNNLGTQRLDCGGASSGGLVCRAPVPAKIGESCDALNDSEEGSCDGSVAFCPFNSTLICTAYTPIGVALGSPGMCVPGTIPASDGTCQPPSNVGASCSHVYCSVDGYCNSAQICAQKKSPGEPCVADGNNGTLGGTCAGTCIDGTCKGDALPPDLCFNPN